MRRLLLNECLWALVVLCATACTMAPAPDSSAALPAHVLPADARALAYGRTLTEVIQSPELRDKILGLFGADWMPAAPGRGQVVLGAVAFLEKGGSPADGPYRWERLHRGYGVRGERLPDPACAAADW